MDERQGLNLKKAKYIVSIPILISTILTVLILYFILINDFAIYVNNGEISHGFVLLIFLFVFIIASMLFYFDYKKIIKG